MGTRICIESSLSCRTSRVALFFSSPYRMHCFRSLHDSVESVIGSRSQQLNEKFKTKHFCARRNCHPNPGWSLSLAKWTRIFKLVLPGFSRCLVFFFAIPYALLSRSLHDSVESASCSIEGCTDLLGATPTTSELIRRSNSAFLAGFLCICCS